MKNKIIIIQLLVFTLFSCERSLELKFTNASGVHFDSLWVDGKFIGELADQKSTPYIQFDSCLARNYHPILFAKAKVGDSLTNDFRLKCSTGVEYIRSGKYDLSIDFGNNYSSEYQALFVQIKN